MTKRYGASGPPPKTPVGYPGMARVRTFSIHPERGVPDNDIREWVSLVERELGIVQITATFIPGTPDRVVWDRLNIIVTKLVDVAPNITHVPR